MRWARRRRVLVRSCAEDALGEARPGAGHSIRGVLICKRALRIEDKVATSQWKVTLSRLGSRQQWEIFHKSSALSPGPAEEPGGQGRAGHDRRQPRGNGYQNQTEPQGPVEGTLDSESRMELPGVQEAPVTLDYAAAWFSWNFFS